MDASLNHSGVWRLLQKIRATFSGLLPSTSQIGICFQIVGTDSKDDLILLIRSNIVQKKFSTGHVQNADCQTLEVTPTLYALL